MSDTRARKQNTEDAVFNRLMKLVQSECERDKASAQGLARRDGGRQMCVRIAAQEICTIVETTP